MAIPDKDKWYFNITHTIGDISDAYDAEHGIEDVSEHDLKLAHCVRLLAMELKRVKEQLEQKENA